MPKLSELLQTAHDPNPTPDDAIPTLKEEGGEATNKMVYLEDLPVSTPTQTALNGKVSKAGDTMTGPLTSSSRYISTEASIPYRHNRVKEIGFGAGGDGEYTVWDYTAGQANLRAFPSGISLGASSNPNIIHGTGFPNGVVSAPTGSVYIDTNVTNGASSWIKKSGTGNTGWVVLQGDTGWRDITTLIPPENTTGGSLHIRRKGDRAYLKAMNLYLIDGNITLIPDIGALLGNNFRPPENVVAIVTISSTMAISNALQLYRTSTTNGVVHLGLKGIRYWATSWECLESWPTTLPGTAA